MTEIPVRHSALLRWLSTPWKLLRKSVIGRHFSTMFLTQIALMLIGVTTGALAARLLGVEGRGELAQVQIWAMFALALGQLGIPDALVYFSSREPQRFGTLVTSAWVVTVPLAFFWMLLGAWFLPIAIQSPQTALLAVWFLMILPFATLGEINHGFLGLQYFRQWSLYRLYWGIMYLFLLLLLIVLQQKQVVFVTVGLLVSYLFSPLLLYWMLRRMQIRLQRPALADSRRLLAYGWRSVLGTAPDQLNARMDQMVIAVVLPAADLGLYVVAVSWSLLLGALFRTIGLVIFPHIAAQDDQEQRRLFVTSTRWSIWLAAISGIALALLTPLLLPLLFGAEFRAAIPLALVLIAGAGFLNVKTVLANGLRGLGLPQAIAQAEFAALFATVVGLVLLLPLVGVMGAAWVSLFSYLLACMMMLGVAIRRSHIHPRDLLVPDATDRQRISRLLRRRKPEMME